MPVSGLVCVVSPRTSLQAAQGHSRRNSSLLKVVTAPSSQVIVRPEVAFRLISVGVGKAGEGCVIMLNFGTMMPLYGSI